jgi:hypothetical protein
MKKLIGKLKHFFIPHEGNDFRANIFRDTSLGILFAIVIITFVAGVGHKFILTGTNYLASIYSGVLVDLANNDRNENSLPQLTINPILESAAELKAEDMAAKGYFAHYGPDGSSPWDWMRKAGYDFVYAGENLAIDFTDSEDVNDAWLNSPTHRANIMNSKFTEIGIATVNGTYNGRKTIYVVQMFGTPLKTAPQTLPIVTPVPINQLAQVSPTGEPEVQGATAISSSTDNKTKAPTTTTKPKQLSLVVKNTIPETDTSESFIAIENASSSAIAGPVAQNPNITEDKTPIKVAKEISTNPRKTVGIIYGLASLLLIMGLVAMIRKDMQIHHLKHALGGVFLMVIIVTLTYIYNHAVFSDAAIVAVNSL